MTSDLELRREIESILDDCESTVGYEDDSHILPINAVDVHAAVPRLLMMVRREAALLNYGCRQCAYEAGVPLPTNAGLCAHHADELETACLSSHHEMGRHNMCLDSDQADKLLERVAELNAQHELEMREILRLLVELNEWKDEYHKLRQTLDSLYEHRQTGVG